MTVASQPVFFIGDVALDEYYQAPYWPAIKEKIIVQPLPAQHGGMIANAACVYAGYGGQAQFLGMLNPGDISQRLITELKRQKVEVQHVVFEPTLPDAKTMVFITENEHTVLIPTLGIQRFPIPQITLHALQNAAAIYTNLVEFKPLICGSFQALDILKHLRQKGVRIIFDLDVDGIADEDFEYIPLIDVGIFNEIGFKHQAKGLEEERAADTLLSAGMEMIVITKGANGCAVYSSQGKKVIPGLPVKVIDVTGAGDTFGASFLYGLEQWGEISKAASFATAAAARSVESMGARSGVASLLEVMAFWANHKS